MKKLLNRFAVWLYIKTEHREFHQGDIFRGMKIMVSDHLPKNTLMMGTKNHKEMKNYLYMQDIRVKK